LDVTLQAQILELLHSLQEKYNTSLLFISHDLGVIAQVCAHALVMYDGRIIESASIQQLFHHPQHPYSQALMLCSPSKEHPCRQPLPSIQQAHIRNETENQQRQRFNQVLKQYQHDKNNFERNKQVAEVHSETIINVKRVNKKFELSSSLLSFSKHNFNAVNNVSFNLNKGQTLGIVGASGSGKTTLAKIISGLLPADSGEVEFQGERIFQRATKSKIERLALAKNIQYIFQDPQESLNSRHNIQTLLTEPLKIHDIGNTKSQISAAEKMLSLLGLPQTILSRYPHEFSGGQKQRISIARALMLAPKLLVCDEPVSALDVSVQAQILNLLVQLQQKLELSIIFITHDLSVVRHIADQIAVMHKGQIIEYGDALQICDKPQQNYTQQLIAAIPSWPVKDNRLA
jgi:peptide/nickel transport system ATP-binding protein